MQGDFVPGSQSSDRIRESRIAVGASLLSLAIFWYAAWRFVPTDTATETVFRLGMLAGSAGVAVDYGRRLFRPALRANDEGIRGNPMWSHKRGVARDDIARHELRREMGLTTLRVYGPAGEVLYRVWLQPDPENVESAVRFLAHDPE